MFLNKNSSCQFHFQPAGDKLVGYHNTNKMTSTDRSSFAEHREKIDRLKAFFSSGATKSYDARRRELLNFQKMLTDNKVEMCRALKEDLHKSLFEAQSVELAILFDDVQLILDELAALMQPETVSSPALTQPCHSELRPEPLGTILIIAPWNYPIFLLLGPLIGAIAAGNTVVLKPSEVAPASCALITTMVSAFLTKDWVTVLQGGEKETTQMLKERYDHIVYTGGGSIGRIVMTAAARHLCPVTLELGGKSPCIVDKDVADIYQAARRILSTKFLNCGQICIAPDYVIVHRSVAADLKQAMTKVLLEFYGDDVESSDSYCRVINQRHWHRLMAYIKEAVHEGAEVVAGGFGTEATKFISPTILHVKNDNVANLIQTKNKLKVMEEEIFGPILPIVIMDNITDTIKYVNANEKPLALYLFTTNDKVQKVVIEGTSSGAVVINDCIFHIANRNLPFGGVGGSGMGSYGGTHSFKVFSHYKPVMNRYTIVDPYLRFPPFTSTNTSIFWRIQTLVRNLRFPLKGKTVLIVIVILIVTMILQRRMSSVPAIKHFQKL